MTRISGEAAVAIIREAFSPLHCGAELFDYDATVRFNVVDSSGKSLVKIVGVTPDEFGDPDRLERLIEQVRSDLAAHKGVQFNAWQMPRP
jgi:hypothetical protein